MERNQRIKFKLASGYLGILAAVNEVVASAQAQNLALILLIMIVTTSFCYRSFVAALMFLVPLILANFLTMVVMVMEKISLVKAKEIAKKKGLKPGRVKGTEGVQFTKGNNDRLEIISWDEFEKTIAKRKLSVYESGGWMKIMKK